MLIWYGHCDSIIIGLSECYVCSNSLEPIITIMATAIYQSWRRFANVHAPPTPSPKKNLHLANERTDAIKPIKAN